MTSKMKKIVAVGAVAILGAAAVGVAVAKRAHDHHHSHPSRHHFSHHGSHYDGDFHGMRGELHMRDGFAGMKTRHLARALDLNPEQREKTRALMNDIREFQRESRQDIRNAVSRAFNADALSAEQAEELLAMRENRRDEMRAFVAAKLAEFHAMLTPAQRERAAQLWTERRHGFRFHRNRHHDGHDDDDDRHDRDRDGKRG